MDIVSLVLNGQSLIGECEHLDGLEVLVARVEAGVNVKAQLAVGVYGQQPSLAAEEHDVVVGKLGFRIYDV